MKEEDSFLKISYSILKIDKYKGKTFGFNEKLLYSFLREFQKNVEVVSPSHTYMCNKLGFRSKATMIRTIKALVSDFDLVDAVFTSGKHTVYKVKEVDYSFVDGCGMEKKARPTDTPIVVDQIDGFTEPSCIPDIVDEDDFISTFLLSCGG
jgi:hypothetical protein